MSALTDATTNKERRQQLKSLGKAILKHEGCRRYLVLYLASDDNGRMREHRSAWFASRECAACALRLISNRYGARNAIIYVD